ncbi:unnamed protein product [Blepharisma stoltei]|uniref:Peptidase C1A papain C-terminal domain-containing protein n=1 Tax=Blepharisma stoltei TaxID=1481888 RepID=A0AAU9IGB9_9CILI|nr:unnamed protein product [Blepharisma stoltei]
MRHLLFLSIFVLALSGPAVKPTDPDLIAMQEMVDEINRVQDSWTASTDWLSQVTIAKAKSKLLTSEPKPRMFPKKDWGALLDYLSIPASFDSRQQWPKCIHPVQNDEGCDGGWAYSATGVLADRFCITTNGTIDVVLSPGFLLVCILDPVEMNCNGGTADAAWQFLVESGTVTEKCVPYHIWSLDDPCPNYCNDHSRFVYYKAAYMQTYAGPSSMQAAILAGGPIETTLKVYEDLLTYKGGIYKHTLGKYIGMSSVKVIGWGNQNGTNYWIAQNVWGTLWGQKGYLWIAFGQVEVDKEAVAGAANPKI